MTSVGQSALLKGWRLLLVVGTAATAASCGSSDPVSRGLSIATAQCSQCHAVGESGDSPRTGAPPFRELSSRYPLVYLEEALAEGIMTGHNEMPQFVFQPAEISDFLAYLETIQQP
jgi:mono/diheme cytochrome c family protein